MGSRVYFIKASLGDGEKVISAKAGKLFKAGGFADCFKEDDFTAVKIHVGEKDNNTYIKAGCLKGLIDELLALKTKPFLTDTSTLYLGGRNNAVDHAISAAKNGFSLDGLGIPFISPDGLLGTSETAVEINCPVNKEVFIASDILMCQSMLSVAHFTGHCAACAAATLKTLGMGCASRKGKLRQHAVVKLTVSERCKGCGECIKHCPAEAITLKAGNAYIDQDKCIGCAECVAVCRYDVIENAGEVENELLQKHIAEHALGVVKGKENRAVFFNYVMSVAKDCDCFGVADIPVVVDDIGITASRDPVAVDKASLDMIEASGGKKFAELIGDSKLDPSYQFEHAENIGLGSCNYELIEVS